LNLPLQHNSGLKFRVFFFFEYFSISFADLIRMRDLPILLYIQGLVMRHIDFADDLELLFQAMFRRI
jgi:hypothetical protein